jgi:hypothetical protein
VRDIVERPDFPLCGARSVARYCRDADERSGFSAGRQPHDPAGLGAVQRQARKQATRDDADYTAGAIAFNLAIRHEPVDPLGYGGALRGPGSIARRWKSATGDAPVRMSARPTWRCCSRAADLTLLVPTQRKS